MNSQSDSKNGAPSARLTARRGWFPVPKADLALLNEQCGEKSATTKAVWLALLQIQNERRAAEFSANISLISYVAGVSRTTAKTCLRKLQEMGFLDIRENRIPGKKESDANTYTLRRSANCRPRGQSNVEAQPLTGSVKKAPARGAKKEIPFEGDGRSAYAAAVPHNPTSDGVW